LSSSSSSVSSASGFIPRPTSTFDTCDFPEIDSFADFEDVEGPEDVPGLYVDGPLSDIPEGANSTQKNQTKSFQPRSYLEYRFSLFKALRNTSLDLGLLGPSPLDH
jgi:hypothetical protein